MYMFSQSWGRSCDYQRQILVINIGCDRLYIFFINNHGPIIIVQIQIDFCFRFVRIHGRYLYLCMIVLRLLTTIVIMCNNQNLCIFFFNHNRSVDVWVYDYIGYQYNYLSRVLKNRKQNSIWIIPILLRYDYGRYINQIFSHNYSPESIKKYLLILLRYDCETIIMMYKSIYSKKIQSNISCNRPILPDGHISLSAIRVRTSA